MKDLSSIAHICRAQPLLNLMANTKKNMDFPFSWKNALMLSWSLDSPLSDNHFYSNQHLAEKPLRPVTQSQLIHPDSFWYTQTDYVMYG